MVLGKGLESNQREHCCVVGGERSDIWIGDGGGEEKGLFAQPAAEDMVVISQAHISFCCHFGSKIWPEFKVLLDNKPSLHGIPNFETVECHNFYPTESRNILPCLSDPRHGPTLVLIYPDKKGQKKALCAREARDRVWYMFVVQNAKSHKEPVTKSHLGYTTFPGINHD